MNNARIDGLRSIELGVHDLQKSAEFYRRVWALEDVAAEGEVFVNRQFGPNPPLLGTMGDSPADDRIRPLPGDLRTIKQDVSLGGADQAALQRAPNAPVSMPFPAAWPPKLIKSRPSIPMLVVLPFVVAR